MYFILSHRSFSYLSSHSNQTEEIELCLRFDIVRVTIEDDSKVICDANIVTITNILIDITF